MAIWGLLIENLRTGESFSTAQGVTPPPDAPVQIVAPFSQQVGFDPLNWPGPLSPGTVTFTLKVANAATLPGFQPGDPIRVRLFANPTGAWTTTDPENTSLFNPYWTHWEYVAAPPVIEPHADYLLMTVTGVDPLSAFSGDTADVALAATDDAFGPHLGDRITQLGALFVDSPIGIAAASDRLINYQFLACGPYTAQQASILDTLNAELAGCGGFKVTPSDQSLAPQPLPVMFARWLPASSKWGIYFAGLNRKGPTRTPYQLQLVGHMATGVVRSGPVENLGDQGRQVTPKLAVLDACLAPIAGTEYSYDHGPNILRLDVLNAAGDVQTIGARQSGNVNADGALSRTVTSHDLYGSGQINQVASWYLGDQAASKATWNARSITIDTRGMTDAQAAAYSTQLLFDVRNPTTYDVVFDIQLALVGVDPTTYGVTSLKGDIVGQLLGATYSIDGNGTLRIACDIQPEIVPQSDTQTYQLTYQKLKDDATLSTVAFHDNTGSSTDNYLDPSISFADMRVIGA